MFDVLCLMCDECCVMGQGVGGWKLEVGVESLDEVAEIAGSIHINSPVLFLSCFCFFHYFIFSCFFLMFHVSFSCCMFHVSCRIFQKYIRHEQCGFTQEDV
jgi:hypothetical protein